MREVEVKALLVDPYQNTPVILLKDEETEKVVPVWIGSPEATAIAMVLQEREFPRPLTHDLLQMVIDNLGGDMDMLVIDNIEDSTYYATIFLRDPYGDVHEIDARPSDSIALALRTQSPIYISDDVFDASAIEMDEIADEEDEETRERFKDFVEREMNLSDFKRFIQ